MIHKYDANHLGGVIVRVGMAAATPFLMAYMMNGREAHAIPIDPSSSPGHYATLSDAPIPGQVLWELPFTAVFNSNGTSYADSFLAGTHTGATSGYDNGLDEEHPPINPFGGLALVSTIGDIDLSTDYRQPTAIGEGEKWLIKLLLKNADGLEGIIDINWNADALPQGSNPTLNDYGNDPTRTLLLGSYDLSSFSQPIQFQVSGAPNQTLYLSLEAEGVSVIPEPKTVALFGAGLAGLAALTAARRRNAGTK